MPASIHVDIITPEAIKFAGAADSIQLPALDGEIGILKDHTALVTMLGAGSAKIRVGGSVQEVVVAQGFATILDNRVTCLVDAAVNREDIKPDAIQGRCSELERTLSTSGKLADSQQGELDYLRAQLRAAALR